MRCLVVLLVFVAGCASARPPAPRPAPDPAPSAGAWTTVGSSVDGRPIQALELGSGAETTLILGGFHGDEPTACRFALDLCAWMEEARELLAGKRVVIVPLVNPDGFAARSRRNARGVDLNRNFPTADWWPDAANPRYCSGPAGGSEPETRAVMELVERLRPAKIVSIHEPLRVNNHDGPGGEALARVMSEENGYPVKGYIGYPTPGSFGTWAGKERGIPMVTLELERGKCAFEHNVGAMAAVVRF